VHLLASYTGPRGLDAVMSYPLYGALRGAFGERQDMTQCAGFVGCRRGSVS
jgi:hypothetical protein